MSLIKYIYTGKRYPFNNIKAYLPYDLLGLRFKNSFSPR